MSGDDRIPWQDRLGDRSEPALWRCRRPRLAAVGGSGNILDGGTGDDEVRGSTGTDTFVFDLVAGSADTDRAVIFDGAVDRLQFLGVSDEGTPGLIDDLDAVLRVIVDQPGGDLVLGFGDDRRIVFRDLGTGAINSIADLVDDPACSAHSGQRGPARLKPQMRLPARASYDVGKRSRSPATSAGNAGVGVEEASPARPALPPRAAWPPAGTTSPARERQANPPGQSLHRKTSRCRPKPDRLQYASRYAVQCESCSRAPQADCALLKFHLHRAAE